MSRASQLRRHITNTHNPKSMSNPTISLKSDYKSENNVKIINPDSSQISYQGSDDAEFIFMQKLRNSTTHADGGSNISRGSDNDDLEDLRGKEGNDAIIGGGWKHGQLNGGAANVPRIRWNESNIFVIPEVIEVADFNVSEGNKIFFMNSKENNSGDVSIAQVGEDAYILPVTLMEQ